MGKFLYTYMFVGKDIDWSEDLRQEILDHVNGLKAAIKQLIGDADDDCDMCDLDYDQVTDGTMRAILRDYEDLFEPTIRELKRELVDNFSLDEVRQFVNLFNGVTKDLEGRYYYPDDMARYEVMLGGSHYSILIAGSQVDCRPSGLAYDLFQRISVTGTSQLLNLQPTYEQRDDS